MSDILQDELRYLRELLVPTKDGPLDWAQVSAPCLRYLLACERMQRVLDEAKRTGTDTPIGSATDFARAQDAKWDAEERARRVGR